MNLKFLKFPVGGSRSQGFRKYLKHPSLQCANGRGRFGGQTAGAPTSLSSARAAPLCSAGIERARKCWQGKYFVRCCHSPHGLLFRGSAGVTREGVSSSLRPEPSACVCSVKKHVYYERNAKETLGEYIFRKTRTWAMAVKRGSYKSLFLLNSGRFPLKGKFSSELWFA